MTKCPVLCMLTCTLMPNGEMVCIGKTFSWFGECKDCLTAVTTVKEN